MSWQTTPRVRPAGPLIALASAAACAAAAFPVQAGDPMQPLSPRLVAASPASTGPRTEPTSSRSAKPASSPRLVAIRQDSQGRWTALFDETWLVVGSRLGNQTVLAIDALSVQLKQGRQTQTLHLLPRLLPSTESAAPAVQTSPSRTGQLAPPAKLSAAQQEVTL
jgi:hypothetical protein